MRDMDIGAAATDGTNALVRCHMLLRVAMREGDKLARKPKKTLFSKAGRCIKKIGDRELINAFNTKIGRVSAGEIAGIERRTYLNVFCHVGVIPNS